MLEFTFLKTFSNTFSITTLRAYSREHVHELLYPFGLYTLCADWLLVDYFANSSRNLTTRALLAQLQFYFQIQLVANTSMRV